jgi:hypothetical protein
MVNISAIIINNHPCYDLLGIFVELDCAPPGLQKKNASDSHASDSIGHHPGCERAVGGLQVPCQPAARPLESLTPFDVHLASRSFSISEYDAKLFEPLSLSVTVGAVDHWYSTVPSDLLVYTVLVPVPTPSVSVGLKLLIELN